MKKVLVITYFFPPDGGNLAQRITKFVKYLPEFGFQPYVLTSDHKCDITDSDLLEEVERVKNVIHVETSPSHMPRWVKSLFKSKYLSDDINWWIKKAIPTAIKWHKNEHFDLIFSEAPHFAVLNLIDQVKKYLNLPWVCDMREMLPVQEIKNNKDVTAQIINNYWESLKQADHLIVNNRKAKEFLQTKLNHDNITQIYDGFDPENFNHVHDVRYRKTKFTIAYCGSLNEEHSPVSFFKALDMMLGSGEINKDQLEINIYGKNVSGMWQVSYYNLKDRIKYYHYQNHLTSLQKMNEAHILLLLETDKSNKGNIPSKVFEYMYLKKPIFAITVSENETTEILKRYGNVYLCTTNSSNEIRLLFLQAYKNWKNNLLKDEADDDFLDEFDCQYHTQQLSEIFDKILKSK